MTVGYNNFDIPALNKARVVGTNAPDVLTESTVLPLHDAAYVALVLPFSIAST
jgi:hypothetical protein